MTTAHNTIMSMDPKQDSAPKKNIGPLTQTTIINNSTTAHVLIIGPQFETYSNLSYLNVEACRNQMAIRGRSFSRRQTGLDKIKNGYTHNRTHSVVSTIKYDFTVRQEVRPC